MEQAPPVAAHPFAEQPVMAEEPAVEEPVMAEEPIFAEEPVAAEEGFHTVEPSPFIAEPGAPEEPVLAEEEPWFVADVQEQPKPERPAQSDTWSGRPIGS